ncbi:MAG: hypothetical protein OEY49_06345 [Candidatus Heimdallarchaeota archaeon]|nr:hypothetical protein [Candidatus Heimdallarchaeota archaeon]
MKVVLIDKNPEVYQYMKEIFKQDGFEFDLVELDHLHSIDNKRIDLLIVNYNNISVDINFQNRSFFAKYSWGIYKYLDLDLKEILLKKGITELIKLPCSPKRIIALANSYKMVLI